MLDFNDVRAFCGSREVDLVMVPPPPPFTLCLHGEFDGYGDFFSFVAKDVEYVELPGAFTVSDLIFTSQAAELATLSPKWLRLGEAYSGPALALRSADAPGWGTDRHVFVVIANHLEWRPGSDWHSAVATK